MNDNWVIAGKPDGELPRIGTAYTIIDSRKGTFVGEVVTVDGDWASVLILAGEIHWKSIENQVFNPNPKEVSIYSRHVYLIELDNIIAPALKASVSGNNIQNETPPSKK